MREGEGGRVRGRRDREGEIQEREEETRGGGGDIAGQRRRSRRRATTVWASPRSIRSFFPSFFSFFIIRFGDDSA